MREAGRNLHATPEQGQLGIATMNDDFQFSMSPLSAGGWAVSTLAVLWITLLKFVLRKYVKTLEENTKHWQDTAGELAGLYARISKLEGRFDERDAHNDRRRN